jgi:LemA protein
MYNPIILLVVVGGVVLFVISAYNGLQALKTQIAASIQEIGNQLKRQASLIPNLEASVKGYMKHERGVFEMLTDARKSVSQAQATNSAKDISAAIDKIQALAPQIAIAIEDNPELKADQTVTRFMQELTDTADKLMYARRSLIDLSQNYNQKLVMFPSNLIASVFGFQAEKGLGVAMSGSHVEVSADEMQDVRVNL